MGVSEALQVTSFVGQVWLITTTMYIYNIWVAFMSVSILLNYKLNELSQT